MAPKDAMKPMKAEHNKKCKLQITTDSTPRKTISNHAPSLECKCSMQIKIFCGANNRFYLSKNNSLNHCHHPPLKCPHVLKVTNKLTIEMIKVQHWKLFASHYNDNDDTLGIG